MCSENGTLFHTTWWFHAWGIEPVVHAVTDEQGKIEAGICFSLGRQLGVGGLVRLPLTPRNGPFFLPPSDDRRHKRNTSVKKMTLAVIYSLPKLEIYDIFLGSCETDVMPYIWRRTRVPIGRIDSVCAYLTASDISSEVELEVECPSFGLNRCASCRSDPPDLFSGIGGENSNGSISGICFYG